MKKLVRNRWQTPDGTILESKHRHDYVSYTDKNGKYYAVDGGKDYCRLVGDYQDLKDLREYIEIEDKDEDGN